MAAYSGKNASVTAGASTDLAELLEWELEYGSNIHEYFSRAGLGAAQTVDGGESGSGTLTMNYDASNPAGSVLPQGALVALTLLLGGGDSCSGTARIGKHKYNAKISGEPVSVTVPFTTHGKWTLPVA